MFKSLTRRWFVSGFSVVAAFLVIVGAVLMLIVRAYYYQTVETALRTRAENYRRSISETVLPGDDFESAGMELVAHFGDAAHMELQVLDASGKVLFSNTGFLSRMGVPEDFSEALTSEERLGCWLGTSSGEHVMALTMPEYAVDGKLIGALRYVVSLRVVDYQLWLLTLLTIAMVVVILLFVGIANYAFLSSVVVPVSEVSKGADRIARGEYDYRIPKRYNDEIGRLGDALNDMAGDLQENERLKNEFISSVSHELRTPLTAIAGWSETLSTVGKEDPELLQKGLSIISGETARLTEMVEGLLNFSRLQNGNVGLQYETFDLSEELEEIAFLFRERAAKAGLRVTFGGETLMIDGDRDKLRRVFINLLDNAVKYAGREGTLRVQAAAEGDCARVTVTDTGVGIPADVLPHITEKFYRGNHRCPGSGIGLPLAEEIVRLHGGNLAVQSTVNTGTTVTVTLPRTAQPTERN